MPFQSKAQIKFLAAKKPEVFNKFRQHTSTNKYKQLPEYAEELAETRKAYLYSKEKEERK